MRKDFRWLDADMDGRETWEVGGLRIGDVHPAAECEPPCVLHAPSDHALADAPARYRIDRWPLLERFCEHGVGHPDPDATAFIVKQTGEEHWWVHGCDGCCG